MTFFFPELQPYRTGHLRLDDVHSMYFEESGNPQGVPLLSIHAGPGSSSKSYHRRMFDPSFWRIIMYDQRGCGQSTPAAELRQNTPALLVQDIETLRRHLQIEKWHVFAGSWGASLGIPYCIKNPAHVASATWRCPYLFQSKDVDYYIYDLRKFRYRAWQRLTTALGRTTDIMATIYRMLRSDDMAQRFLATQEFRAYQDSVSLPQEEENLSTLPPEKFQKIWAQFLLETEFSLFHTYPDDWFKGHGAALANIPCHIIQGGYDIVCAPEGSYQLQQAWPNSTLEVVKGAGHNADDGDILPAIIRRMQTLQASLA